MGAPLRLRRGGCESSPSTAFHMFPLPSAPPEAQAKDPVMTLSTDPPTITLRPHEPAELLAQAHLCLGTVPRDSIVLVGRRSPGGSAIAARIPLEVILEADAPQEFLSQLALLGQHGCDGAFAVSLAGDGLEPCTEESRDRAVLAGVRLLAGITALLPGFDLPEVWVIGGGTAMPVLLEPVGDDAYDLGIGPQEPLPPLRETLVALQAAHAGLQMPADETARRQRLLQAASRVSAVRAPRPLAPLSLLWERAAPALSALAGQTPGATDPAPSMTHCEQVRAALESLSSPGGAEELLALLVDTGFEGPAALETVLWDLVNDPTLVPLANVCAGGDDYRTIEDLRALLGDGRGGEDHRVCEDPAAAWSALTAALCVLAWWNHRFATAGDLADALGEAQPGDPLAPLLARLAGSSIAPAWEPPPAQGRCGASGTVRPLRAPGRRPRRR